MSLTALDTTRSEAPSLHRHYAASSVLWAPPTSDRPRPLPRRGSRPSADRTSHVAPESLPGVPLPLPRWTAVAACVGASPRRGGLPPVRAESASTSRTFEACSGFTRVAAHKFARCTDVHLLSPRLRPTRLPSLAARIATELYRHVLGWDLHPLVLCAFRGTP